MQTYTIYRLSPVFIKLVLAFSAVALYLVYLDITSEQERLPLSMILFVGYILFPFLAKTFFLRRVDLKIETDDNGIPTNIEVYFADSAEEETVEAYKFSASDVTSLTTPASNYGKLVIKLNDGTSISLLKHHLAARDDDFTTVSGILSGIREHQEAQIEEPENWYSSETVSFMRRFGSLLVDGLVTYLLLKLIFTFVELPAGSDYFLIATSIFSVLFLFKDTLFLNRSIGKRLLGIRITSVKTGEPPAFWRVIVRNLTLAITFLNIIEFVFALFKPQRRIGDYVAGTRVTRNT